MPKNSTVMKGASFPEGGPIFLGKIAWGCQISWAAEFPVTPKPTHQGTFLLVFVFHRRKTLVPFFTILYRFVQLWVASYPGHIVESGYEAKLRAECVLFLCWPWVLLVTVQQFTISISC